MELKEAIDQIKAALAGLQSKGQDVVQITALISYLDQLAQNAPIALQERELKHLSDLEAYKAQSASRIELFKATIATAQTALKTSLLVNGGASIAVLAFMGNILSKVDHMAIAQLAMLHRLSAVLISFSIGVGLGAIATATTYLAQSSFHYQHDQMGRVFRWTSIVLVLSSYVVFGYGIWRASSALLQ